MKKFFLLSLFFSIFLAGTQLHAQFYVGANVGYGVPFTAEPFGLTYDFVQDEDENYTKRVLTNNYGNGGQGFRASIQPGYMFNENFGFELGAYYFSSPEIFVQDTLNGIGKYETFTKGWHLRLTPALVFIAGSGGKIMPYAKVGLCIPVAGVINARRYSDDPFLVNELFDTLFPDSKEFNLNAKFEGQFSVGFEAVAGAQMKISDKLNVFGELVMTSLRIRRATAEITEAILLKADGTEMDMKSLLSLGNVFTFTEFVDEVDLLQMAEDRKDSEYGSVASKPHKILASDGAYNAIGINVGIRFTF